MHTFETSQCHQTHCAVEASHGSPSTRLRAELCLLAATSETPVAHFPLPRACPLADAPDGSTKQKPSFILLVPKCVCPRVPAFVL
ncbi:unnamed protein product [Protopolystoma xenopodis]|uniref:Uncharacterized protein n=1 Tax=Protopolystoma xenopodis TaxID=117903 RepID=A0A448XRY3_9PLAT|nr:unnamed protein product [Protopolystoma xenopodis]